MKINEILLKPILTEKSTNLVKQSVYTFEVDLAATKSQIKSTIEKLFSAKVASVKSQIRKGKERRVGRRQIPKKQADKKLVFVKLTTGKIDLFPQA